MFFYLIFNSTIIKHNLELKSKIIKTLLYGCIAYIIIHATLFIGGVNALLYNFKTYFWLFFILDCIVLNMVIHSKYNIRIDRIIKKLIPFITPGKSININPEIGRDQNNVTKNKTTNSQPKKVHFNKSPHKVKLYNDYDSDSDSDSDSDAESEMNTDLDIDFKQFKNSLDFSE
jgi:hypothetical protein